MPGDEPTDHDALLDEVVAELEATRTACFVLDAALRLRWASTEMHARWALGARSSATAST